MKRRSEIDKLVEASLSLVDDEYGTCIAPDEVYTMVKPWRPAGVEDLSITTKTEKI